MRSILLLMSVAALSVTCAAPRPESAAPRPETSSVDPVVTYLNRALAATSQDAQQAEFDKIVAMGCKAVPGLAAHLDDARKLPIPYLRLENRSERAFEAYRQYGPETVTDAVAAILNHTTGQHFGFIYNGASDQERSATIAAWRKYFRETPSEKVCDQVGAGG